MSNKIQLSNKQREINTNLAITGALGALTIILGITRLGLIPWFSGASITILHVPVILATLLCGLWSGIGVGLIFGIFSLIQASIAPSGVLDPYFTNPLYSILPRLLIAPVTFFVYKGLSIINKKKNLFLTSISTTIASFLGSLSNSFFVLGIFVLTGIIDWKMLWTVIITNGVLEAIAAIIICLTITTIINANNNRKSKLSSEVDD